MWRDFVSRHAHPNLSVWKQKADSHGRVSTPKVNTVGKNKKSDGRTRNRKIAAMADKAAETDLAIDALVDESDTVMPPARIIIGRRPQRAPLQRRLHLRRARG